MSDEPQQARVMESVRLPNTRSWKDGAGPRFLLRWWRPARLGFLTVHEDADFAWAALDAGGLGYVVKARLASDLLGPFLRMGRASQLGEAPLPRSSPRCSELENINSSNRQHPRF